jgi:hypothetical protein
MIVSCATLAVAGLMLSYRRASKKIFFIIGFFVVSIAGIIFWLWYQSLYSGDNLNIPYQWREPAPAAIENLAFSKKTEMSSLAYPIFFPYAYTSGTAVDGVKTTGTGFITGLEKQPWWTVDLHQSHRIGKIVIHEGFFGPDINKRPLLICFSMDGQKWRLGHVIEGDKDKPKTKIQFKNHPTARYVLIKSSRNCRLSLAEVVIHP